MVDAKSLYAPFFRWAKRRKIIRRNCGVEIAPDTFVLSMAPGCSAPMSTNYLTKQVAKLKEHLGIENRRRPSGRCR